LFARADGRLLVDAKCSNAGDVAAAKKKKVALERERRKELTNFFYRLQSCVPSLRTAPTRPTKAILLQSACDYIQTLESELTQLRCRTRTTARARDTHTTSPHTAPRVFGV
jgi:type VI protein secretion system component VasF